MYKCDGCIDRVKAGLAPACVEACPQNAIRYGEKEAMRAYAHQRVKEIGGYIYGKLEGGGTSTFYLSRIPFEQIDEALLSQKEEPRMPVAAKNVLDSPNGMAQAMLIAPIAGVFAAGLAAHKKMKGEEKNNG